MNESAASNPSGGHVGRHREREGQGRGREWPRCARSVHREVRFPKPVKAEVADAARLALEIIETVPVFLATGPARGAERGDSSRS
jgi:hypothetical protein